MLTRRTRMGLAIAAAAVFAAGSLATSRASAAEGPTATPAVSQTGGASVQLVRHGWGHHHGYGRGYHGHGWGGYYRPAVRPYVGFGFGPAYGYGGNCYRW